MTTNRQRIKPKPDSAPAEWVQLDKLKPWPDNPRIHTKTIQKLTVSIQQFGFADPIVARKANNMVIGGHARLKAAKILGLKKVPVRFMDLSESDAHALAIASNRLTELSDYEDVTLARVLAELKKEEKLAFTGFEDTDLDELVAKLKAEAAMGMGDNFDAEKALAENPELGADVKRGDIYQLGEHRVMCGDATNENDVGRLMDGTYQSLVTDPPYGVSYAAKNEFLNTIARGNRIQTPIAGDHQTPEEMSAFWRKAFVAIRRFAEPGATYYVTGPQGGDLLLLLLALRDSGFPLRHMLIWAKNNHVLGRADYNYKHEPVIYGWVEGAAHIFNGGSGQTSLWEIDKPHESKLHPTMKPVALFARAITNGSNLGAVIFDPFLGSGTTLIAAERLGRRCFGMEIEPRYVAVSIARWEAETGSQAVLMERKD